jgi:hypothetical protein
MKNNKPIWFNKTGAVTEINIGHRQSKYKIFVATPVHSECIYSLHTSTIKVSTKLPYKKVY